MNVAERLVEILEEKRLGLVVVHIDAHAVLTVAGYKAWF